MSSNTPTNNSSAGSSTKVDCTRASQNVWLVKVFIAIHVLNYSLKKKYN